MGERQPFRTDERPIYEGNVTDIYTMSSEIKGFFKGWAFVGAVTLTVALFAGVSFALPVSAHNGGNHNGWSAENHNDDNDHGDHNGDNDHHDGDHEDGDHHDGDHHDGDHHDSDTTDDEGGSNAVDNENNDVPPPPPTPTTITITATAIVCDHESSLPNWSLTGVQITSTSAADFLLSHIGCHLAEGWSFEYGDQNTVEAADDFVGPAGNGYTTFGPTDVSGIVSTVVPVAGVTDFHLREVLRDGFIPFGYTMGTTTSAEFYCADDVAYFDNFDFIYGPVAGQGYHCIGFNAPTVEVDTCPSGKHWDSEAQVCVNNPVVTQCADGIDNDEDGLTDQNDPGCWSNPSDSNSCNVQDDSESADLCANLEGTQQTVPNGTHLSEGNCVEDSTGGGNGGNGGSDSSSSETTGGGGNGPVLGNGPISFGVVGGAVLGTSTTNLPELPGSCNALLHTYMRMGRHNDVEEVKKLQTFLNQYMGAGLTVSGFFGPSTDKAVREFQKKYQPHVLTPWGIANATGFVYKTTQRWINLTNCASLNIPMPDLTN